MAKKILLAVDESENSQKAVDFVAVSMNKDASVTVLSILPEPSAACGMDSPSLVPLFKESRQAFCTIEEGKRELLRQGADKAKAKLVAAGFKAESITVNIKKRDQGIARDILAEARKGGYDVLVLGRRGLTGIKEFLFGSVSNKVAQAATERTVVIVD